MRFFIRFISIYVLLFQSCNIAPGSYPYAERYKVNFPEDSIIKAIEAFKEENPEFIVPKVTIDNEYFWTLNDGKTQGPSLWYAFYFYYKESDQIVLTLTRPLDTNKTIISLVSINKGLKLEDWKRINKDLSLDENTKQKNKFENRILFEVEKHLNNNSVGQP